MEVILFQLDGRIPNIALMRIAHHHRAKGDEVEFRWTGSPRRELWDNPDLVYGSAIFTKTAESVERLKREFPGAIVGGTGTEDQITLEDIGVGIEKDYSLYPRWEQSIGFLQRGCRLKCPFCVVPTKEGKMRPEQGVYDLWRGDPFPRELIVLDNDFFGNPLWQEHIDGIKSGGFKVNFNQGINCRFLTPESAEAIASINYRDVSMKARRIYTAWDNRKDEKRVIRGLEYLVDAGVKPDHIMVYMLIGYWPGETIESWLYRRDVLRKFGAVPYPMPFARTRETVGFQRWCVGAYDKRFKWEDWEAANYRPENLGQLTDNPQQQLL